MSVLCCDPVIFDDHIDEIDQYLDDLWDWNKNKSQNQSRDYLPRHPKKQNIYQKQRYNSSEVPTTYEYW